MSARGFHRAGSGEPLVLLHGFSATWHIWQPLLERLEAEHDVFAPTLAGHTGGAPWPDGVEVSLAALVDAVERDMDAAGMTTAHIVGNSLGGWLALELAARGRARSVVGLSPAGGFLKGSREARRLKRVFMRLHRMSTWALPRIDRLTRRPLGRRFLLGQVMAHGERLSANDVAEMVRRSVETPVYFDFMTSVERDGGLRQLEPIECPVLVAWGTRDWTIPARRYSALIREQLPHAQWLSLKGLGHCPMGDDPELIARTIADFVRAASAATPAAARQPA